jgi:general secretion pathway protein H
LRSRLQAYALQAAALLQADRNAAIRRGTNVAVLVDAPARAIRSGTTRNVLRIPDDVQFDALLPQTCEQRAVFSTINFFANGMSCGGTIALMRLDAGYEIRVNWLTGRIDIVSRTTTN